MNDRAFDRHSRTLASPTSRRRALRGLGGFGAAAAAIGAGLAPGRAASQEASPAASASATGDAHPIFMFVQVAEAGTWRPKPGEPGVFLLTLDDVAEETVFFSDRSERIVGTVPNQTFLANLGFTPANPPNAALVVQTETGQDILVIELLNPSYEPLMEQLTYEALVLPPGEAGEALGHLAARQADLELPERFGAASLFIDDCPDEYIFCYTDCFHAPGDLGPREMCFNWTPSIWACQPCTGGWEGIDAECNATFPACNDACFTDAWKHCLPPA